MFEDILATEKGKPTFLLLLLWCIFHELSPLFTESTDSAEWKT